ncbi:hypothetical protein HN748_01420 [Candidatus Peregrinibacteria bacterium]|jgi:hypothetical protein|nr:hypothetical protein [Candidatus Peregrinibacteria bacterium]MBT7483274.1 hypothetical protein [Candidatus Peregrinibacteria bacterium]MBT7702870.1 hypothetical protein [Candidatus Peregrinibacteria bacterium]
MPEKIISPLSKIKLGISLVVFLGVLAGITFFVSLLGESHFQGGPIENPEQVQYVAVGDIEVQNETLSSGMSFETNEDSELGIEFELADLIRLYSDTEVVFETVDLESDPIKIEAQLKKGSMWISDLQGTVDLTLKTEKVQIQPQNGSTYIEYNDGSAYVLAAHHPTFITFLNDEGEVLNNFSLTESHEVSIRESSVSDVLSQLRYTKLTKEFPFTYLEQDDWKTDWEIALDADQDRLSDVYMQFISDLRHYGNGGFEDGSFRAQIQNLYRAVRSILTFSDTHLLTVEEDEDLDLLIQSFYLTLQGDSSLAKNRLQEFGKEAADFETLEKLTAFDRLFKSVYFGDIFYTAKSLVRDIQYDKAPTEDRLLLSLMFLRESLNEVYDLLDQGERMTAKEALYAYSDTWQTLISRSGSDLAEMVQGLTAERQILQNLLYREDIFYEVQSYEVLSTLEDRILNLTAEEYDLNEERQAFVQDKLQVLDRLVDLVDDELVSENEALDLGYLLMSEARDLLNDITSEAAVNDYFAEKLKEYSLMFEFIGSSDFALAQGSFDDAFHDYLEKQGELEALSEYILGLTEEEEETELTLEEAQAEAEKAFDEEGIDYTALVALGDQSYRLFQVEGGRVDLIDFDANYDRVSGILYDLEVEGDVFSTGVKLADLEEAIEQATTEEVEEIEEEVEVERALTALESFAIDLAETTLALEGLEVSKDEISIVDLDENLFGVVYVMTYSGDEVLVEFLYDEDTVEALEIIATQGEQVVTFDDEVGVKDLETLVEVLFADLEEEEAEEAAMAEEV